ncbi:MAG: hypothetical protein ACXVI9_08410 [Mucilaginibacter sp.]
MFKINAPYVDLPRCEHQFYNKNQSHSCGGYTVDDFLKGKTEYSIGLFNDFPAEYRKIGLFEIHPVKTRVALLTRMRFCSINKKLPIISISI